jgi:two-component system, chemotaxis family, CheB/CheR fusion protein
LIRKNVNEHIPSEDHIVVGIGASAGGLEALKKLFENLTETTGLTFIVLQHLAENQKSMLPEILAKFTKMNVKETENNMLVKPNNVYVLPPGKTITIDNYTLNLSPKGTSLKPIDTFLTSLGQKLKNKSIGIILSGTGTDGTEGIQTINAESGITFVQDPDTAQYSDMPKSAISTGAVDFILSPENIAKELIKLPTQPKNLSTFEKNQKFSVIFSLLNKEFQVNFNNYKIPTVTRRINRRMAINNIESLKDYVQFLKANKSELDSLFGDLLINVTSFFRENKTLDLLKEVVFPELIKNKTRDQSIRIWVPGCSTGEEVYSVAIELVEYLEKNNFLNFKVQIFGTDVNNKNIENARKGIYLKKIEETISEDRLKRFFVSNNGNYQITKQIRDICLFAPHDLTSNPPFSNLDIIVCRNVFIYFESYIQERLFPLFHYGLKPNGYLVLGESESVGKFTNLFQSLVKKVPIYQKKQVLQNYSIQWGLPSSSVSNINITSITENYMPILEKKIDSILMSEYVTASLVLNSDLDILAVRGKIDPYVSIEAGLASLNASKIIRKELRSTLQIAVFNAKKELKQVKDTVQFRQDNKVRTIIIHVKPIKLPQQETIFFLVLFNEPSIDTPKQKKSKAPINQDQKETVESQQFKELSEAFETTKQTLQTIIEQKEVINEELHSSMEELQSSNEELMSTNEELETAKEELHSTNEELGTLNDELKNRNETLTTLNDDLTNLMDNVDSAIVILDADLTIKRFNRKAEEILSLKPEAFNSLITGFRLGIPILNFNDLLVKAQHFEFVRQEISDDNGKWYQLRIRPYLNQDKKVFGLVLSFVDITEIRLLQEKLLVLSSFTRHDLRNKLSVIRGNIFLAQKRSKDKPELAKFLNPLTDIFSQVDRILDFSKTYEMMGKQTLEYVDLGMMVDQAKVEYFSNSKGITILNEVKGFRVLADSILVTLFGNLINNTIKYGEKATCIRIYAYNNPDNSVSLVYEDDGVGISFSNKVKIFNKGFSTGNCTGLGLFLIKKIVEIYGWNITENGEPGKGVRFVINIPKNKTQEINSNS